MDGSVCTQCSNRLLDNWLGRQIGSYDKKEKVAMTFQDIHRGYWENWWSIYEDIVKFLSQL